MSVDPLSNKYPGWSPYNYVQDDPELLLDQAGMDNHSTNNEQASTTSYTTYQYGPQGLYRFNVNRTSAEGAPRNFSLSDYNRQIGTAGAMLKNFANQTAEANSKVAGLVGIAAAVGAVAATVAGQPEIAAPLTEAAVSSFTLAGQSRIVSFGLTDVPKWVSGKESTAEAFSHASPIVTGLIFGRFVDASPTEVRIVGKLLEEQAGEAFKQIIQGFAH